MFQKWNIIKSSVVEFLEFDSNVFATKVAVEQNKLKTFEFVRPFPQNVQYKTHTRTHVHMMSGSKWWRPDRLPTPGLLTNEEGNLYSGKLWRNG